MRLYQKNKLWTKIDMEVLKSLQAASGGNAIKPNWILLLDKPTAHIGPC